MTYMVWIYDPTISFTAFIRTTIIVIDIVIAGSL